MPIIKISLVVKHFKKGKKTQKDYLFPKEVYGGVIEIEEPEKFIDATLKTFSDKNELPVRVYPNVDKEIFCVIRRKEGNIRFILETELAAGEPIARFSITGQIVPKSKFTNWSATMKVLNRS
jgi:hypothetical protein